jgi:hypothetical protein
MFSTPDRAGGSAGSPPLSARDIVVKTIVTHTVTYFITGVAAYVLVDYPSLIAENTLALSMRPLNDPMVMAGPLLQPVRGLLFGLVFYMLREPFLGRKRGWLTMWVVLVSIGVLGTFGAPPGSLEGLIYTVLPLSVHLKLLPEVMVQSLLLSWILFHWLNRPGRRWISWTMSAAFLVVLLLPVLGLVVTVRR